MSTSDLSQPHKSRWLWFSFFSALGIGFLLRGESESTKLLAAGFLLLGAFSFHHDPLDPKSLPLKSSVARLSAFAGLLGGGLVLAAAFVALSG